MLTPVMNALAHHQFWKRKTARRLGCIGYGGYTHMAGDRGNFRIEADRHAVVRALAQDVE